MQLLPSPAAVVVILLKCGGGGGGAAEAAPPRPPVCPSSGGVAPPPRTVHSVLTLQGNMSVCSLDTVNGVLCSVSYSCSVHCLLQWLLTASRVMVSAVPGRPGLTGLRLGPARSSLNSLYTYHSGHCGPPSPVTAALPSPRVAPCGPLLRDDAAKDVTEIKKQTGLRLLL